MQLGDIRLLEVQSKNTRLPGEEDQPLLFCRHTSRTPSSHAAGEPIEILVHLKARIAPTAEEPEPFFDVSARFELTYFVPEDFQATDEELKAFGETNAVFNAWPYFREIVQSMAARMALPTVVLPVFRVPLPGPPDRQVPEGEPAKAVRSAR